MDRVSSTPPIADESLALLEYETIFDGAPVGIVFTRMGTLKRCNPRMARMFDYAPADLAECQASVLFANIEEYEAFRAEFSRVITSGQLFEMPVQRLRRRDGSTFLGRIRARAVSSDRRDAGTVWMVEDVSEARASQIEVQAIMNNTAIGIMFTRDRQLTRYNRGFAEMFGYGGDEAIGMPVRALYRDEQRHIAVGTAARELFGQRESVRTETEMVRKDGTPMWVQLFGHLINPDDAAQGTIWLIEDRTRHKRDEESLRNALLENQAILDNAVLGVAVVENGRTLHCNAKMEELFGYPPGGIDGQKVRSLYADGAAWMAARRETANDFLSGRVHMAEYEMMRADG